MKQIELNNIELAEIRNLAEEKRRSLGYFEETPIAKDLFIILDKLEIALLEYPIESDIDSPAFSAALIYCEEMDEKLVFIGLNTSDFYDKQLFAIAHELYHFYTKTGTHISRNEENYSNIVEIKANRFAAEFLLPESVLSNIVLSEFKTYSLKEVNYKALLRFIARIHNIYWIPYKSIVKRLKEIDAISSIQYNQLYSLEERDLDSEYGRIGKAIDEDIFIKLNKPTKRMGTSSKEIELIIRNFEDNLISEDELIETLNLFNKTPDEFGYEVKISQNDIDEINDFFSAEDDDES